jgi:hypothetical protein
MDASMCGQKRRTFTWPKEARELARAYLIAGGKRHTLITSLAQISGHPRDACLRFARQLGVINKRPYRKWTRKETDQLLQLCESHPLRTVSLKLQRSQTAVRGMLDRLGVSGRIGKDSFTKYVLASLLHVRPQLIQRWVDSGLVNAHMEGTERLPRVVITADDFVDFCKKHPEAILRGRVREERLDFVIEYAFPRSHVDLLPVREAKKERAAYAAQIQDEDDSFGPEAEFRDFTEEGGSSLGLTA